MTGQNIEPEGREVEFPLARSTSNEYDWAPPVDSPGQTENPLKVVADRLHGRWRLAILLGLVLSPLLAWAGYSLTPLTYRSASVLVVESSLSTLVEETIETAGIREFAAFVKEKAQQVRDTQVFLTAFEDPGLKEFEEIRPDFRQTVYDGISVDNPSRSSLVIVSLEDKDPEFAAAAVNAVVGAYRSIYAPDPMAQHKARVDQIDRLVKASRSKLSSLKLARNQVSVDSRYGRSDLRGTIEDNVMLIRSISLEIDGVEDLMSRLREQFALNARLLAESEGKEITPEDLEPTARAQIKPGLNDLQSVDPALEQLDAELTQLEINFQVTARRFGPLHTKYRREKISLDSKQATFEGRLEAAKQEWAQSADSKSSWGALIERKSTLDAELQRFVGMNMDLEKARIEAEDYDGKIEQEKTELAKLEERLMNLEREKEAIREGRIRFPPTKAMPAFGPTKDKKIPVAIGGFVGGWIFSIGLFFLLGAIDHKTFGVRQLKGHAHGLRVLGVLPNMDELGKDGSTVMLASDCVHRIRGRIESRRAPERGYALMVSSPFQGDGKTTLAVSLGWSYAESGYKTLLVDADFVGRAMTHQFGRLKEPGLREVVRNGALGEEVVELGHPNLSLLGVGFDRRITAANLSPRLVSRVIELLRTDYEIIIIDSGPLTASIEALPIASAADGVVLALRRGRSRLRLTECMADIRSVGADYLGVVLNYADRSDCERYGSNSKMSRDVAESLGGDAALESEVPSNSLLDNLRLSEK